MKESKKQTIEQATVEAYFGKIIEHESEKIGITFPSAVKIVQSFVFLVSDKHARWFKNIYATFDKWATSPNEPIEQADIYEINGDRFDCVLFDKQAVFASVFNELADIELWTEEIWNEKLTAFYTATGQTEKLEALQTKFEEGNK